MPDYSKVSLADGTETQRITQHTRRNMTMYGFGERAIEVLETIKSQLNADIWVDKLRKRNLVIPQTMEILESPQVFETSRENGASFDFDLTYLGEHLIAAEFSPVGITPVFDPEHRVRVFGSLDEISAADFSTDGFVYRAAAKQYSQSNHIGNMYVGWKIPGGVNITPGVLSAAITAG
ncbi:MAG: hypothetical protein LBP81_08675 [Treponema sp.]|jgi:hypothetical protein|nr:hypothetical protein [Treponema sp.]